MDYNYNGYDRGYTEPAMTSADYMNRTYRWMAVGLLITFAAAFVTAATPLLYVVNSLYLVFTIAELVLVYVLSSRVQNMSVGGARATFFAYALLNGMVLSYYFLVFDLGTLVLAFLATSLYFGLMAVYGTTTHKDLSGWGPKLMMGLFALIITGFVGMLFGMSFLTTVLYSAVGLVVFMLLTAYDTQSEAEDILNDITKQKGPPFSGEPLRIKNQLRRRLFMPSRRTTYRKMLMKSRYNVSAP